MSIDGADLSGGSPLPGQILGKVRLRTAKGEICRWQDYKAVNLHGHRQEAFLQDNQNLME